VGAAGADRVEQWFTPGVAFVLLVTAGTAAAYALWLGWFAWRPDLSASDPTMVSAHHARITLRMRNHGPDPVRLGPAILQRPEGARLATCPNASLDGDPRLNDLAEVLPNASVQIDLYVAAAPWLWTTPGSRCVRIKLYVHSGQVRPRTSWYTISRVLPG
jgi:hypothetical protein